MPELPDSSGCFNLSTNTLITKENNTEPYARYIRSMDHCSSSKNSKGV
jgi:hypothetical protein